MSRPCATIVIPTLNRQRLLSGTLRCALTQVDVELEVIVVDDGSSDATQAYLKTVHDDRLLVLRHDRSRGVSAARNTGIAAAKGTWIAFLDDDDLWAPEELKAQLDAMRDEPEAGWCCAGSVEVDGLLRIMALSRPPTSRDVMSLVRSDNPIPGGGSGVLASRDLLQSVGEFDSTFNLLADWDYWIRLAQESPLAIVDRPLTAHVMHGGNMSVVDSGYGRELVELEAKFKAKGIPLAPAMPYAGAALQGGSTAEAARMFLRVGIKHRRLEPLLHGLVAWTGPRFRRLARRAYDMRNGDYWRNEANAWLEPIRSSSRPAGLQM